MAATYFEYETIGREAGLSPEALADLESSVHAEYPQDPMMRELRLLRMCIAIRDGYLTVDVALQSQAPNPSSSMAR